MELQIKLMFTVQEANLVLAALGQRPWAEVSGLMEKIKVQGEAQLAAAQAPTAEGPAENPAEG
jgi:hypothetical protein